MGVNIGPRIQIEGEDAYRKQILDIIQETKTLKSEYEKVTSAFDKGKQSLSQNAEMHRVLQERIEAQKDRIGELNYMLGLACDKFGETDTKTLKWEQALNEATAELNRMQKELDDLPNSIELVGQKMQTVGESISKAGEKIQKFGNVLAPLSAAASGVLIGSTKAAIDFETAMTGVQKTNNELVDSNGNVIISYADLADSVKKMATETASSKEEIASVMEAAGQLGVGTEYLEDFTRTMVMMGDSTNLSADEAASALAKFANVTQMSLSDTDKLGSVIVALGNNFATTEQDIVEMATRLSGAGHQIGLTDAQIMGFATALSSVGIQAEMGGSAFSKAMIKMQVATESAYEQFNAFQDTIASFQGGETKSLRDFQLWLAAEPKAMENLIGWSRMTKEEINNLLNSRAELENFAKVAGTSVDEFVKNYRDDAPAALQAFISGLGDTETHGESTIQMLQEMGFTEVRLRDTLTRLASSGDLVTTAIDMGNRAWEENTALTDEASKKYDTTAAKVSQAKEKITNVAIEIGERMLPVVEKLADALDKAVVAWDGLDEGQKDAITNGLAVTAGLAPVILTAGKLTENIGTLTTSGGNLIEALGGITSSAGATNGAMAALNPTTLGVVAATAALSAAFVTAYQTDEEFRKKTTGSLNDVKISWDGFIAEVGPKWNEFCKLLTPVFLTAFDGVNDIIRQAKNILSGAFDFFSGLMTLDLKRVLDGAWKIWSTIATLWTTPFKTINNFIKNVFNVDIAKGFKDLARIATSWGRDLIDNFIGGIYDMWDNARGVVEDFANMIADFLAFSEPEKGPLSDFHTYAPDMMKLFAKGIRDNANLVTNQIARSFDFQDLMTSDVALPVEMMPTAYAPTASNTVTVGDTQIVINAVDGETAEELADKVSDIINMRYRKAEMAWA